MGLGSFVYYIILGSDVLFDLIEDRIVNIMDEFTLSEIEKLLVIYSNLNEKRKKTVFD